MNTELSVEELIEPLQTVIGVVEKKPLQTVIGVVEKNKPSQYFHTF